MSVPLRFLAAFAVLASPAAFAQEDRLSTPLDDRFRITSGVFQVKTETNMRLDATAGTPGTALSGEEDLNLRDSSTMADFEVELRVRERHRVRFSYFGMERKASTVLTRQIRFGDDVYNVSDLVQSSLDIIDFTTAYSYTFWRRERFELGASLALHMMEFNAHARVPARSIDEEEAQTAPVPAVGLQATVRFNRRLHAEARAEYLSAHTDDFEGEVRNLRAAILYRFNRNISVGLGYTALQTEVISLDAGDTGRFGLTNKGGQLILRAAF